MDEIVEVTAASKGAVRNPKYDQLEQQNKSRTPTTQKIVSEGFRTSLTHYLDSDEIRPVLFKGDAQTVLSDFPNDCIDCVITSPPYWGKREYENGGIGLEKSHEEYIANLVGIFLEVQRILKPTGSFWLNIGDTYKNKSLLGLPWRIVFELTDNQGWVLRNSVVWNKVKSGMDNSKDRLGNIHENVFTFCKKV